MNLLYFFFEKFNLKSFTILFSILMLINGIVMFLNVKYLFLGIEFIFIDIIIMIFLFGIYGLYIVFDLNKGIDKLDNDLNNAINDLKNLNKYVDKSNDNLNKIERDLNDH